MKKIYFINLMDIVLKKLNYQKILESINFKILKYGRGKKYFGKNWHLDFYLLLKMK